MVKKPHTEPISPRVRQLSAHYPAINPNHQQVTLLRHNLRMLKSVSPMRHRAQQQLDPPGSITSEYPFVCQLNTATPGKRNFGVLYQQISFSLQIFDKRFIPLLSGLGLV